MQAVSDAVPEAVLDAVPEVVSVDGKTLRRSFDAASKQSPIHMVHAWAGENRLILGQLTVADRSNEIPAVRQLLGTLNLEGATVTADAMHCQRETASQILEQGGDYWLAVKGNQGTLHEDLKAYWGENGAVPGSVMHRTVDAGHGRIETRTVRVCNQVEGIQHDHDWPGLKAVAMVSSVREFKAAHDDRPPSQSVRYCIMSHDRSARTTAAIVTLPLGRGKSATLGVGCGLQRGPKSQPMRQCSRQSFPHAEIRVEYVAQRAFHHLGTAKTIKSST